MRADLPSTQANLMLKSALDHMGNHTVLRRARLYITLVLLVLGTLSCGQGLMNAVKPSGSQDFQWSPSRYLLHHENPYRLYLAHRSGEIKDNPFPLSQVPNYPASALIFLWPLAALNLEGAKWFWAGANMLMGIGCVALLARMTDTTKVIALALLGLFFMSTPVRNTIGNGQHGLFSLYFFLLAVHFQIRNQTPLAALCLAACWLKYTITFPLCLIFIRRGWRTTLVIAAAIHLGLVLFLSFWVSENPLNLLVGPLMVSKTGIDSTMFDTMALTSYFGVESQQAGVGFGIAILMAAAWAVARSKIDLATDLIVLSFVSLVWSHHASYDYFVLIIPLFLAARHLLQRSIGLVDILVAMSVLFVWFVPRVLDAANSLFPKHGALALADQIIFWSACLCIYVALLAALTKVYMQGRQGTN